MKKRLVNHHKLIRSFDRTADKTGRFFDKLFRRKKSPRKMKDYTWKGTQYNPYRTEDTSAKRGILLKLSILLVSVILLIYFIVFSGLFNITTITVSGNIRITTEDIVRLVRKTLDYRSVGFIPNSSFFIANTEDIKEVLKGRFPIDQISIEKRFPHNLHIDLTEKLSTVVYDNGVVYGLVGLDGSVIELIRAVENREWKDVFGKIVTTTSDGTTSTIDVVLEKVHIPDVRDIRTETGEYPIVYDKRQHTTDEGLIVMTPTEVQLIIDWYNEIKTTPVTISLITIEDDSDFFITTEEGWVIKTRFSRKNAADQIRELKLALEKIETTSRLSYIDLRYESRIYWK